MNIPTISVIIPCYNQGKFLYDCLNSLRNSKFPAYEVILVNDGSTEVETLNILTSLRHEFSKLKLKIEHKQNGGLASARNAGLQLATGSYVQFLDSDDMIEPNKFEKQVDLFNAHPTKSCIVSDYVFVTENGKIDTTPAPSIAGHPLTTLDFLTNWEKTLSIPIHCGLFKRSALNGLKFSASFKAKEDWVFWTELSHRIGGEGFLYHPDRYAIYRLNPASMTKRDPVLMLSEWIKAQTFLFTKFGDIFSDEALLYELNRNQEHIHQAYIAEILTRANPATHTKPSLYEQGVRQLQLFPRFYKFLRPIFRFLKLFVQSFSRRA